MIGAFVGVRYLVNLQNARCNNKDNCYTTFFIFQLMLRDVSALAVTIFKELCLGQ
jgi:hypothetical protein